MHVTVSGTEEAILMVEAGAKEVSEQKMLDAIMFAHEEIKKLIKFQKEIVAKIGKEKRKADRKRQDQIFRRYDCTVSY